ncbi:MAG: AbrB family looped-hinge helix DNA binding protein [Limisphaerales bacterium]|jgi:AbrB family looped-hinge helix DNA binding protein
MPVKESVETITFTTKGQIVIPRKLRRLFEIEEGTKATVESTPNGILIKPVTAALIRKGRGLLKKGSTPLSREWAQHKAEEHKLEDKPHGRTGS